MPAVGQRRQAEGRQRRGERHLVEVEVERLPEPPGEPVGQPDRQTARPSQQFDGQPGHRHRGERKQNRLGHQQRRGPREHPVERRQHREHRAEMVAEQVEAGTLQSTVGAPSRE